MSISFLEQSLARHWRLLGLGIALLSAVLVAGCGLAPSSANGKNGVNDKKPEVIVTTPILGKVTDYEDFTGRLDALKTVDIRARVSGYVKQAPFKEGDQVREGDLLFEIDPRTYAADLNQAKANLKLAEADSRLQQKNAARARQLIGNKAMAQEDYDTAEATAEKAKATVKSMEAARDRAQLYLDFTRVTAPWNGRISRRLVDPGNLVNADNTILTTMVTEDPLYAYFDVDERTYLNLVEARSQRSEVRNQKSEVGGQKSENASQNSGAGLSLGARRGSPDPAEHLDRRSPFASGDLRSESGAGSGDPRTAPALTSAPVLMRLANETEFSRPGTVNFVDNRVNATTGTVRMRGIFPNPEGSLKPGLFARIRLPIGQPYDALLIPDEALLSDQGKSYVYVVTSEEKVEYRPVKIGQGVQGLRVIKPAEKGKEGKEGLSNGERVIVSGMQRVRRGAQVQATMQAPPKPPESPLSRLLTQLPSIRPGDTETRRPGDRETRSPGDRKSNNGTPKAGSPSAGN